MLMVFILILTLILHPFNPYYLNLYIQISYQFMNVKKTSVHKLSKDRSLKDLSSKKNQPNTNFKGKIGEEIRKKLKVNNNVNNGVLKADKENIVYNSKGRNQEKKAFEDIQKTSLISLKPLGAKTSRTSLEDKFLNPTKGQYHRSSSKSVRFSDKFQQCTLRRKGSSSSILKNSSIVKKSNLSERGSLNNSICSNIMKEDQSSENMTMNKVVKEKYQRTLSNIQKLQKKYCDELYPPVWSSLCRVCSSDIQGIRWKRISDLFPGKYLTLWDTQLKITVGPGRHSKNKAQANCFNTIKHNHFLMEKLFESQKYNTNGIYYVKINQNNSWKYVIIDDYVPVCVGKDGKTDESAYLTLTSPSSTQIQIWPLLLQKAYAKYYSTYECLEKSNQLDFIEEITGCPMERVEVTEGNMRKVQEQIKNFDTILFAKHQNQKIYPIVPRREEITLENPIENYAEMTVPQSQFLREFVEVYCIFLHKYYYTGFCSVRFNSKGSEVEDQHISLRSIKVEEYTDCVISLSQKDAKHYSQSYSYVWVRVLVVMKESSKNYRWIDGAYTNAKNSHVFMSLQPGEYFIILIPQWQKAKTGFDFNVVFHGNTKCTFERKPYKGNEFMITEAAMDLAQRNGILKQLNQNICTYSYIERKLGFIIENINNQRHNGHVRVLRSIEGLQRGSKKLIHAFNKQFRTEQTIQVKIESLDHFTVVLGVVGGVNKGFLDQFDFGS